MKITKSTHFVLRFGQRDINYDHVKQAIKNPDSRRDLSDGKIWVIKRMGDEFLEVVYFKKYLERSQDEYVLITAYYKDKK